MLEWSLTSSVLIVLVLVVRFIFKEKIKSKYIYALWLLVAVRLLCPVNFGELPFNLLTFVEQGEAYLVEGFQEFMDTKNTESVKGTGETDENYSKTTEYHVFGTYVMHEGDYEDYFSLEEEMQNTRIYMTLTFREIVIVVWLVGVIIMGIVILSVNISFGARLSLFRKELPAFARKGRGKTVLSVYTADGISSSCLFGLKTPAIYLNKREMKEQEKEYCVEHEYSHYMQGDMFWNLCRTLCLILHWYNPLVWLAVSLSKRDAELACDERTVERLGEQERFAYGHTLVEIAAGQSKSVQVLGMATLMSPDKKEVVERVKAITIKKESKIITGVLVSVLAVAISIFVFTGEAKGGESPEGIQESIGANEGDFGLPQGSMDEEADKIVETYEDSDYVGVYEDKTTGEMWAASEDGSQRLISETPMDEVVYKELVFTDCIKLEQTKGNGWRIDLNGDGIKEEIYFSDLVFYINNQLVWVVWNYEEPIWIMDIDTTDGKYEIFSDKGVLFVYDGEKLAQTWSLTNHKWDNGMTYRGKLEEFERVDEHTISFEDIGKQGGFFSGRWTMEYQLNEKHELVMVQKIYELEKTKVLFYMGVTEGDELLTLYEEPDKSSMVTEVTESIVFEATKTDGSNWIYVKRLDTATKFSEEISGKNVEGWIYYPDAKKHIGIRE